MGKILKTIKHEFLEVIPPTIFFFVSFSLLIVTKTLILKDYGIHFSGYARAVVGALMIGKILLIVDKFSFVSKFPDRPLIYNVVWKTMIYLLAAFIFRYGEHLFHFLSKYGNFIEANRQLWGEINWPHFWLIQMWLSVLLFVYCAFREYVRAVGSEEVVHMFLGLRKKTEKASSRN